MSETLLKNACCQKSLNEINIVITIFRMTLHMTRRIRVEAMAHISSAVGSSRPH